MSMDCESILKVVILPILIYKINKIPIKVPEGFLKINDPILMYMKC